MGIVLDGLKMDAWTLWWWAKYGRLSTDGLRTCTEAFMKEAIVHIQVVSSFIHQNITRPKVISWVVNRNLPVYNGKAASPKHIRELAYQPCIISPEKIARNITTTGLLLFAFSWKIWIYRSFILFHYCQTEIDFNWFHGMQHRNQWNVCID